MTICAKMTHSVFCELLEPKLKSRMFTNPENVAIVFFV